VQFEFEGSLLALVLDPLLLAGGQFALDKPVFAGGLTRYTIINILSPEKRRYRNFW
jgi:hypothetical protein